jgi:hypothetical protein
MAEFETPPVQSSAMAKKTASTPSTTTPRARKTAKPAAAAAADSAAPGNGGVTASPRQPSAEEIAEAAYRRYLSRGGQHGSDFDDWIEAERELTKR